MSRRIALIVLLAAVLAGCTPESMRQFRAMLKMESAGGCRTDKIQFTQETGCLNDGSFEFCVADDPDLLADLQQRVPDMTCMRARGRAQCDRDAQVLCLVATDGLCRLDSPRAMNDAGWHLACELAEQPYVQQLVATWYE